jgi:hypothetical protein
MTQLPTEITPALFVTCELANLFILRLKLLSA